MPRFSKETALATLADCGYEIVAYQFTNSQALNWQNLFVGGRTARKLAKLLLSGRGAICSFNDQPDSVVPISGRSVVAGRGPVARELA